MKFRKYPLTNAPLQIDRIVHTLSQSVTGSDFSTGKRRPQIKKRKYARYATQRTLSPSPL